MKATGIIRPIDDLGRIVLPIELRKAMNINKKDLLEIFVNDSTIILKKYDKSCIFCASTDNIQDFKGHSVCQNCLNEISNI